MQVNFLIRNGTIVDGSGAPAYKADVRVRDGRIAEIGAGLERQGRERIFDATGCYVTPGTIEQHNHWDAAMWWSPMMEPAAAYGITTSINGSCGFSMAPLRPEEDLRQDVIDIYNYFEDVPEKPMMTHVPWDWQTWGEYKASSERNVRTPVNIAAYCGHVTLRLAAMGREAWNRTASPAEIERMCTMLDEALASGALGLSSNLLDYDKRERPLPPMVADDAEWLALMRVVARYPGAVMQIPTDNLMRRTGLEDAKRMGNLLRQVPGIRVQMAGLPPTLIFQKDILPPLEALYAEMKADGLDVWSGYHHVGYSLQLNFAASLLFAQQGNLVWQEVVNETDEDKKMTLLADPEWRARAREAWGNQYAHTLLNRPAEMLLRESETGAGPTGISLADYMEQKGIDHPSDALADWAIDNGPRSAVLLPAWINNDEILVQLFRDPKGLGNISDFGAHTTIMCGAGHNLMMLTYWHRDRGLITIEEAVHVLTGKVADFHSLNDRGRIEVGKRADIVVFDLAEIEVRPETKIWDQPDGHGGRTFRYSRPAAPMRLTLVNGVATFDNGDVTGAFPGEFIVPQANDALAIAAE